MSDRIAQALEHIGKELTALRQNAEALVAFQEWQAGVYREARDGGLPDDFPHREKLEAAGIASLDQVPSSSRRLRQIDGIDWHAATDILNALMKQVKEPA